MTKEEFTMLTGINVTDEEFETINGMYMAAGDDFDKKHFCEDYRAFGDSTLMYRFYRLLQETEAKLKEAEAHLADVNEKLTKTREEADRYHGWWLGESDKTEKQKGVFEKKLQHLQDMHEAFKAKTIEFVKLTAEML